MSEAGTRVGARPEVGSYREYYAAGYFELEAIEDRSDRSPALDLMRVSQSTATSDPARPELAVIMPTRATGDEVRFDFSRGRFVGHAVVGRFVVAPAFTDCEFEGGGPIDLQIASIDYGSLAAIAGEVSDADLAALDVLHSRQWTDPAVTWLMHRLWACAGEPDAPHVRLILDGGAAMLVGELMRLAGTPLPDVRDASRLPGPVMDRVVDYLHAHLHEPVGVEELAEIAGCTRYHFSRLFLRTTGESPHRYLTRLRVERASVLLSTTGLGMDAVAQRVGFSGRRGLARAFRRMQGTAPGAVRETQGR